MRRRLVGGNPLTITLHTGAHGQVSITLEVNTTRDTVMGQGTQRHHVRQVVALYRLRVTGTADAHGRFSRRVAIAYQPRTPLLASIAVTVRLPQGTATGRATATAPAAAPPLSSGKVFHNPLQAVPAVGKHTLGRADESGTASIRRGEGDDDGRSVGQHDLRSDGRPAGESCTPGWAVLVTSTSRRALSTRTVLAASARVRTSAPSSQARLRHQPDATPPR